MRANSDRSEVILHPQRLRILRALAGGRLTTQQLSATLPEIPAATLYRHLRTLRDAGVVEVVSEQRVRAVAERVYSIAGGGAVVTAADLARASRTDHFRYFATFLTGLLAQFDRYLMRKHVDPAADSLGYRELVLNLTDEENAALIAGLQSLLRPLVANTRTPDRTPRLVATILFPLDESESS